MGKGLNRRQPCSVVMPKVSLMKVSMSVVYPYGAMP
jgi:hypothetical protein